MSIYFDNRQEKREIDQKLLKLLESVIENALERGDQDSCRGLHFLGGR